MNIEYSQAQITITTLSPLHIGNGEQLSAVGEFYTTQDKIYFLDNERLIQAVKEIGKLDDYINKILEVGIDLDFYDLLQNWGIDPRLFAEKVINLNQEGLLSSNNNILHKCIKTNECAYIPGSSLKGLFRTAMVVHFFANNPYYFDRLEKSIREELKKGGGKKEIGKLWSKLEKKYFPDFIFHCIRFSDSTVLSEDKLVIEQMSRISFYENDGEGVDWLLECIHPDSSSKVEMTILPKLDNERIEFHFKNKSTDSQDFNINNWEYIKKQDIPAFFKMLNAYSLILIDFEIELLRRTSQNKGIAKLLIATLEGYKESIKESGNQYGIARLGKGKTLFFQTIVPILSKDLRNKIIDLYRDDPDLDSSGIDFPRTRVLSVKSKESNGWIKLDYEQIEKKIIEEQIIHQEAIKKTFIDNKISHFDIGTNLHAVSIDLKKVEIMINGEVSSYDLVNKFKKSFPVNIQLKVVIHQISKAGKIIQVKLR